VATRPTETDLCWRNDGDSAVTPEQRMDIDPKGSCEHAIRAALEKQHPTKKGRQCHG
jgi:hypothetical protein